MAKYRGGAGRDDRFVGDESADVFVFIPRHLNHRDTVIGGGGSATDILFFTQPGTITASDLSGVSQVERIRLAAGTNSLTLDDHFVSTADGARVQILGAAGDDTIDASALTGAHAIDFISGGGTDRVTGGAGDDSFTFDIASFDANDTIVGGAGVNILRFTGSGTLSAGQFTGIKDIDRIELGNGGVSLAVGNALLAASGRRTMTIEGGSRADTIDLTDLRVDYYYQLAVQGGAGADRIIGNGSSYALLDGGKGADTISSTGWGSVVYDRNDVSATVNGGMLYVRGRATIDLTRTDDQSIGDRNVVTGFTSADAELATAGVTLTTTGQYSYLRGGAFADTLIGGATMRGGAGRDTMIGGTSMTVFQLYAGDFERGEVIRGNSDRDILQVVGINDIRQGDVTGIEGISFGDAINGGGELYAKASQLLDVITINPYRGHLYITMQPGVALLPSWRPSGAMVPYISVTGTRNDDVISSVAFYDVRAGAGDDYILAEGSIWGESGNDTIRTGVNKDRVLDGGTGSDTLILSGAMSGGATIDLSRTSDQLIPGTLGEAYVKVSNFEHIDLAVMGYNGVMTIYGDESANVIVTGTSSTQDGSVVSGRGGDDRITGGVRNDRIDGGTGNDWIDGIWGDDMLDGGDGDDQIFGGEGNDTIDGGAGNDWLVGGPGADRLTGGAGADTFVWTDRGTDGDVILDFEAVDRLAFAVDSFRVDGGVLDVRTESAERRPDLTGVDLFVYTGGPLSNAGGIGTLMSRARGLPTDGGLFVLGQDDALHAKLYHVDFSPVFGTRIELIADLGTDVALDMIQLESLMLI